MMPVRLFAKATAEKLCIDEHHVRRFGVKTL